MGRSKIKLFKMQLDVSDITVGCLETLQKDFPDMKASDIMGFMLDLGAVSALQLKKHFEEKNPPEKGEEKKEVV